MTPESGPTSPQRPLVMVGCGILRHEVEFLIRKNRWHVATHFLDSALHNYFDRLATSLENALTAEARDDRDALVFYGSCHPLMEKMLERHHVVRTPGQNCIVMLLGYERFMAELSKGAYFLIEDWARTWQPMITACFGPNLSVVREIFHSSHTLMIALRTPCSGDFTAAAEDAARFVDLPLEWMNVDLSHLETVLADAIGKAEAQRAAQ